MFKKIFKIANTFPINIQNKIYFSEKEMGPVLLNRSATLRAY